MDPKMKVRYERRAEVFKALAHPVRLFMVEQLAFGEKCVCDLTSMLDIDMSTVSKHLSVLRNAGVVSDEKRGANVYYRIRMGCVLGFFACVQEAIERQAREHLTVVSV